MDVPPYVTVGGSPARPHGMNLEGLRRRGFSEAVRRMLKQAYKVLYRENLSLQDALVKLRALAVDCPEVGVLVQFLETQKRGIVR
jgi:UDP-N-acetylglucosamine acyltransferase